MHLHMSPVAFLTFYSTQKEGDYVGAKINVGANVKLPQVSCVVIT